MSEGVIQRISNHVERRLEAGEAYVICRECGARLWSTDANPNNPVDVDVTCPYVGTKLEEAYGCTPPYR